MGGRAALGSVRVSKEMRCGKQVGPLGKRIGNPKWMGWGGAGRGGADFLLLLEAKVHYCRLLVRRGGGAALVIGVGWMQGLGPEFRWDCRGGDGCMDGWMDGWIDRASERAWLAAPFGDCCRPSPLSPRCAVSERAGVLESLAGAPVIERHFQAAHHQAIVGSNRR